MLPEKKNVLPGGQSLKRIPTQRIFLFLMHQGGDVSIFNKVKPKGQVLSGAIKARKASAYSGFHSVK